MFNQQWLHGNPHANNRRLCALATDADRAAISLKKTKLSGTVFLASDALMAKNGGKPIYKLQPEDGQVIERAILDMQDQASRYRAYC